MKNKSIKWLIGKESYGDMNHECTCTCRREVVEEMSELQGTVADTDSRCEMVFMSVCNVLWGFWLPSWVTFHHLGSSFSRKWRQRCTVSNNPCTLMNNRSGEKPNIFPTFSFFLEISHTIYFFYNHGYF